METPGPGEELWGPFNLGRIVQAKEYVGRALRLSVAPQTRQPGPKGSRGSQRKKMMSVGWTANRVSASLGETLLLVPWGLRGFGQCCTSAPTQPPCITLFGVSKVVVTGTKASVGNVPTDQQYLAPLHSLVRPSAVNLRRLCVRASYVPTGCPRAARVTSIQRVYLHTLQSELILAVESSVSNSTMWVEEDLTGCARKCASLLHIGLG